RGDRLLTGGELKIARNQQPFVEPEPAISMSEAVAGETPLGLPPVACHEGDSLATVHLDQVARERADAGRVVDGHAGIARLARADGQRRPHVEALEQD